METKIVLKPNDTGDFVGEVVIVRPGKPSASYDIEEYKWTREQLIEKFEDLLINLTANDWPLKIPANTVGSYAVGWS